MLESDILDDRQEKQARGHYDSTWRVAHAALPALLPTPPKWKMLLPPTSQSRSPSLAALTPRDGTRARPKPASTEPLASSSLCSRSADSVRSSAGIRTRIVTYRARTRADSVERWDAHKASLNGHFSRVSCTFNTLTHQHRRHFCMK